MAPHCTASGRIERPMRCPPLTHVELTLASRPKAMAQVCTTTMSLTCRPSRLAATDQRRTRKVNLHL
jgi:hypothetical protein